jgi:cobalt-zinc-cadmium resistance protein CzcA
VLALILAVLAITFRALKPALLVFALVPFAAVGGVGALAARDLPISLPAAIGFIALSGIAVMNGVVWVARALELRGQGIEPAAAARAAALDRARPVLMTALVAAFGFLPMMLSRGVGAEVQRPLATVVVGGLISSTALTLFVLPALYPWLAGRKKLRAHED